MTRWVTAAALMALAAAMAVQAREQVTLDRIETLVQQGRATTAETELQRLLDSSESAEARDVLGMILSGQGRFEEAEEQFTRAVELAPDLPAPRQHLGRVLLQQGRVSSALAEIRVAAQLGPLERDLALWLADAELSRGNDAAAESQLASAVERYGSVHAMLELARLYGRRGENSKAAAILDRALESAPNSEDVLAARARVSMAAEAPVLAIQALETLTRLHPTVAEYHYLLGLARLQIGDMAGSIEALQESLKLVPDQPLALIALGMTLNAQKYFDEAKEVARRSIRLDPESARALAVLAEAEEGLGEKALAESHAEQALTLDPAHAGAMATIGRIRMSQGRYEEARDLFLRSLAEAPKTAKTHYQLSLAFARLGDRESSSEHRELYRRYRQESDDRLVELRTRAGLGNSGMATP